MKDISNELSEDYRDKVWQRILNDAGGEVPDYRHLYHTFYTDALGEKK